MTDLTKAHLIRGMYFTPYEGAGVTKQVCTCSSIPTTPMAKGRTLSLGALHSLGTRSSLSKAVEAPRKRLLKFSASWTPIRKGPVNYYHPAWVTKWNVDPMETIP